MTRTEELDGLFDKWKKQRPEEAQRMRLDGLVFNALSPYWRGPEDDEDGQEAWFTARNASRIG